MPKNNWLFDSGGIDISNKVLSMNLKEGREKYLDSYSGGSLTFTINNADNYASTLPYSGPIILRSKSDNSEFYEWYWVREVIYEDHPGNTGLNTAIIVCSDWLARSGQTNANNKAIAAASTNYNFREFQDTRGGPLYQTMFVATINSSSFCAASTYTGSVLNFYNYLVATERGYLVNRISTLYPIGRNVVATYAPGTVTLDRTTSNTQIAYESFERIQNGTQFINTATTNPNGLTAQTASNNDSVGSYGQSFFSSSTVDDTEIQALGNAQWIANTFNDPQSLRFTCTFDDVAQNETALTNFMQQIFGGTNRLINFNYQVPGGSNTTITCVIEGFTINATPNFTRYVLNLSPLQYYQFFTLDSELLGILGGGPIVYNQETINYDEPNWVYNDSNVEQGARLGW